MIYVTHGVVSSWDSARISHALFLSESSFVLHLQRRGAKYVSLARSLAGEGDALTIDDATFGGFRAALLAQKYGHEVSWFVNGIHVERGLPYFPFQLSCMVDATALDECALDGQTWDLRSPGGRRALRLHLKQRYMRMRSENEIAELLKATAACLGVDANTGDWSLRTVTSAELTAAAAAGVDLQNHGWSHLNPLLLSSAECTADALFNEEYLSQFRRAVTRTYAPPFGSPVKLKSKTSEWVLLANRGLAPGRHSRNTVNRRELRLNERPAVIAEIDRTLPWAVGA